MVNKNIESFQWVPFLEHVLTGSHLNTYHAHVDSCHGKYGDLKAVLLDAGGFNIHECLDTFLSHFRPGGSLSASQWSQLSAHCIFIVLRKCLELNHLADSDIKAVASAISSCSVLSTLPREGRAFVFTSEPTTAHDRVLAYWQYNGKPQNVDRPYRTYRHEHERVPADKFHNRRKFPSSNSYNSEARFQSHRTSIESGTSETTFPVTCFKCNNEGHYADRCPERRTNSVSTPSVSQRTSENKPPASTSILQLILVPQLIKRKIMTNQFAIIVSGVSDEGCTETLRDCLNVKDGAPRKFNGNENISGFPCTLRLDLGADVSVISADLVMPDDSIVAHTVIMRFDHIKYKVPKYCLPFKSYDVSGNCLFAVYDKLTAKYALIGCDLGNTFHELLSIAIAQAHSVLVTRAQTSALAVEDSERNAQQQADEGLPISLADIDSLQSDDEPSDEITPVLPCESDIVPNDDTCLSVSSEFQPNVTSECHSPVNNSVSHFPSLAALDNVNDCTSQGAIANANISDSSLASSCSIPVIGFDGITKSDLIRMQTEDESIAVEGVLMCLTTTNGRVAHAVVVPKSLREKVLHAAHDLLGHFGIDATRALINGNFTWPGLYEDVKKYVGSCNAFQKFLKNISTQGSSDSSRDYC